MLTGSVAMNYYATPRMTREIDIVVALPNRVTDKVIKIFQDAYYLSPDAVLDAVRNCKTFNHTHIHNTS